MTEQTPVFNVPVDTLIDFIVKNQLWRQYLESYKDSSKRFYSNSLRFLLLYTIMYSGVFLYFWDKVITLTNLSVILIGTIIVLDPIWSITSPETVGSLVSVKTALHKILDTTLVCITVVVESFRVLLEGLLT